ncbi:N-acetyltransferase [Lentilitoribacter sp. Alg239-R112]|nr:N-acetyltransferase [Lentilitoribacter sp. Alg239-R112]
MEDAKEKQLKVQPVCPYAAAQFRRHPEWSDLLQ